MMKVIKYCIWGIACLLMICACTEEDHIFSNSPTDNVEKGIEKGVMMKVNANIVPLQEVNTRVAKVVHEFNSDDRIGIFYNDTCTNRSFCFSGNEWLGSQIKLDANIKDVYAYYPYDKSVTNLNAVPVDIRTQQDYLFGTAPVAKELPNVNISMKHALSLVRIVIKKHEYSGAGVVRFVQWNNIIQSGTMDCTTGKVTNGTQMVTLQAGGEYTLDDKKTPIPVEAILMPVVSTKGISVTIDIDGKLRTYQLPDTHNFEQGKAYTYTLLLTAEYNTPIALDECPVDVAYWTSFGKTDQIVLGTSDSDFFTVEPYSLEGADAYRMEGKQLGFFGYWTGYNPQTGEIPATWEGEFRMVLLDNNGNIVEKFQPCEIIAKNGSLMKGTSRRSFITAPTGKYELSALFRKKGTSSWIKADRSENVSKQDMELNVYEQTTLPALRQVQVNGEYNDGVFVYDRPFGADFLITYVLSNRANIPIKGEIKAVWERTFEYGGNTYRPCHKRADMLNDDQWKDEIGRIRVDLASTIRFWNGSISCRFPVKREAPRSVEGILYYAPVVHLYFKADGANEWKLLRQDCDPLLAAQPKTSREEGALYVLTNNYLLFNQTHW